MGEVKEPCFGVECKLNKGVAVTCSDLTCMYSPSSLPLRRATGMRPLAVPRAVRHLVPHPALACGMPPPAMLLRATLHLPPQGRGTAGMKLRDGGRPREQTEVRSYTTMQSDWLVQDLLSPSSVEPQARIHFTAQLESKIVVQPVHITVCFRGAEQLHER